LLVLIANFMKYDAAARFSFGGARQSLAAACILCVIRSADSTADILLRSSRASFMANPLVSVVAIMSHVIAAGLCNSLKQVGNSCDTLRHGNN
jgi:hypothetical protein